MGAIREITRIVRVTELVKKVEEAVEVTKFPIDRAMRIRIHYDPAASTCGVVIDADGSPDDFGNAKLFVPCDSVCWLGAAWSPFAYRIAFIMEYRTAAVMNRAAKLLGERYGVPFVYENLTLMPGTCPMTSLSSGENPKNRTGRLKCAIKCAGGSRMISLRRPQGLTYADGKTEVMRKNIL